MSISTPSIILSRIYRAEPSSPIAVFRTSTSGELDAVFAKTALTQKRINQKAKKLVGVFHKRDSRKDVRDLLMEIAGE